MVLGTRPEAIKMAPIIQCCRSGDSGVEAIVCSTGQHREMLAQVLDYFEITADIDLQLMRDNQTLAALTSRCLEGLDRTIADVSPDFVVAQGDTTTVLAAALAAFYRRVPFMHVEAGLRSGNLLAPWPEEANRRMAGVLTNIHCAPTERSRQHLLNEGVPAENVHVTGNTVIDALLQTVERERGRTDQWTQKYQQLADRRMVLITGHRRENFGEGFDAICKAIRSLAEQFPEVFFLYPVHLNPQVQQPVKAALGALENVVLAKPAPYPEFVWLMDRSTLILTDSGGVQEEAPSLGKPILVMRDNTERPEAVDAGAAELVGTSADRIVQSVSQLLTDDAAYQSRQVVANPYGDGRAAKRIVDLLIAR